MAVTNSATRVRNAVSELKSSVRELIESAPSDSVETVFEAVYPARSTLSTRGARLAMFNAVVNLLSADLRANGARRRVTP